MGFNFIEQMNSVQAYLEQHPIVFLALFAWTIYWKGMALWKASKRNEQKWFIAILVLNTIGILDILYIYIFSERGKKNTESPPVA